MSILEDRRDQAFPVLSPSQIQIARRFSSGEPRRFTPGEVVFKVGDRHCPSWLVLEGSIEAVRTDGLGVERPIAVEGVGEISGEISQLSARSALTTGRAGPSGLLACPFDAAHLRALVIGSAEVGEMLMRAFILRRVAMIEAGDAGPVVLGIPGSRPMMELQTFLRRNGFPMTVLDASDGEEGHHDLMTRLGVQPADLPLLLCPDGRMVKRPNAAQAGAFLGLTPDLDPESLFDVAIVGGGPAGLATAVYAGSEGLDVVVLEKRAVGGQAGASARIENYLGFPTGISGQALAGRAFNQALKFGAQIAIPLEAAALIREGGEHAPLQVQVADGPLLRARTVVIASGARYRRPEIENLSKFEGVSVSYWASPIEAKLCEGASIALVGAGNSAGQAVVFLAPKVAKLHMIVRDEGLEATMSAYLIERISALPNVEIHRRTTVTKLNAGATGQLASAEFKHLDTHESRTHDLHHLFLFIGADPNSGWVKDSVELDQHGFVRTGDPAKAEGGRPCLPHETSQRGVFAIGDIRSGSTKRVGAAIGEGAAVVAQIHAVLAEQRKADT